MTFKGKSNVQQKNIRLDTKKPYHFDRYQKRSVLSKKEQPKTTGKNRENLNRSITSSFLVELGFTKTL